MTDLPPTGVFVRLPLSEDQAHVFLKESSHTWDEFNGASDAIACEGGLIAIGTPVTADELYPVGYINEDAIGGLATGIYQSASIFRDEEKEHHDSVALVRLDVAQGKIAERDAEIARLRKSLENIRDLPLPLMDLPAATMHSIAHKALKGPGA